MFGHGLLEPILSFKSRGGLVLQTQLSSLFNSQLLSQPSRSAPFNHRREIGCGCSRRQGPLAELRD